MSRRAQFSEVLEPLTRRCTTARTQAVVASTVVAPYTVAGSTVVVGFTTVALQLTTATPGQVAVAVPFLAKARARFPDGVRDARSTCRGAIGSDRAGATVGRAG